MHRVVLKYLVIAVFAISAVLISCDNKEEEEENGFSFDIETKAITLNVGETQPVTAVFSFITGDADVQNTDLKWSSDNPEIALVNNKGEISGMKAGRTVITVEGGFSYKIKCNSNFCWDKNNSIIYDACQDLNAKFRVYGTGTFTIDWGDGSEIETHALKNFPFDDFDYWISLNDLDENDYLQHTYSEEYHYNVTDVTQRLNSL